jgi:hypothetical protein
MWCDGVEITDVEIKPKRIVSINGKAWIGPENEDKLVKVPLEGSMEIKSTGKKFESYGFTVNYEQFKINPSKNLTSRLSYNPLYGPLGQKNNAPQAFSY